VVDFISVGFPHVTHFLTDPSGASTIFVLLTYRAMSSAEEIFNPSYNSCDEVSSICPIEATLYGYQPTLGATALFTAIFAINLVITLGLMIRSRLWSFQAWLSVGLIFEVVGYAGRLMMHQDPWK
jgi:uncharacterized membrane protein